MAAGEGPNMESTPTWAVAITSVVIILISCILERGLHCIGELFKRKKMENMYEALEKIKEELMIMGFISLLLVVFQDTIAGLCIDKKLAGEWLPCNHKSPSVSKTSHFQRFLAESPSDSTSSGNCKPGKVPFMSLTALHDLHLFIFALAVVQVIISVLTFAAGGYKIRRWSQWERSILKEINENEAKDEVINVQNHDFIKNRFWGIDSSFRGWGYSFFKHISGSITESDYKQLRKGFIMNHCKANPKFNFHKYTLRAFEMDFKHVVGINWYLWVFVVLLLLLNVAGWRTGFILSFIPLLLLLLIGTKLEHIITTLATQVASKHSVIIGDVEIKPSDDLFWFKKPRIVLVVIHLIIFANSFEIAVFFWALFTYNIKSCFIGSITYLVPRLIIVVVVQLASTYSTLPLYAIVTQMGSSFSKAIFEENVQESILSWAERAKVKKVEKSSHVILNRSNSESSDTPMRRQNIQSSSDIEIQPMPW